MTLGKHGRMVRAGIALGLAWLVGRSAGAQADSPALFSAPETSSAAAQAAYGAEAGPRLFAPGGADCQTPYLAPQPMIQSAPPIQTVPLVPLPQDSSPRPGPLSGPIFAPPPAGARSTAPPASPLADVAPGGMVSPQFGLPAGPEVPSALDNPQRIPIVDDQLAWEQITDVVTDYFPIASEQQARRNGQQWSEGRIETKFASGATWLEPHRGDSVGTFNRWESTFQTIRRRAIVRVIPDQGGYLVEVIVEKELEDVPRPEHATAGAAAFRGGGSLPSRRTDRVSRSRSSPRWIRLGRDQALEARMLADLHARLTGVTTAATPSPWP